RARNPEFHVKYLCIVLMGTLLISSAAGVEKQFGAMQMDRRLSPSDLYDSVREAQRRFALESLEVRVFVEFSDIALAQNACSWAQAQGLSVFTGHEAKRQSWNCVLETEHASVAALEESAQIVEELERVYGGTASNWMVSGELIESGPQARNEDLCQGLPPAVTCRSRNIR
ncbi:MAG: hypothetical protein AAGD11_20970, partial [Planctomycetota bacterium]